MLTIEQQTAESVAARNERLARLEKSADQGWEKVDVKAFRFALPRLSTEESFAAVDKAKATSILDIFLSILSPEILTTTWNTFPPEYWVYGSGAAAGTFNGGKLSLKFIYVYLAVYIYICGQQNAPKESSKVRNPLREAITSALEHFSSQDPLRRLPSRSIIERFWGRFYIPIVVWPSICKNFQDLLIRPGRCLAGDEKLLHFTGNSGYIRIVPSKPDRVGLWFFELVATLHNGDPFLVHTRLCNACAETGDTIPVNKVVKEWASVVRYFAEEKRCPPPVLVFDSYYTDAEGRKFLNENNVKFIGSIMTYRFRSLMDNLVEHGSMVEKPGQTSSIFNPQTNEIFVHHWDLNADVGKKYVLSNAMNRVPATRSNADIVPAYDQYKGLFNACDKFNRKFHDRKFCHRSGGGTRMGQNGHTWKFLMACILQNTFSAYKSTHADESFDLSFCDMCEILCKELIRHCSTHM